MGMTVFADVRDGATCGSCTIGHGTIIAQPVVQWIGLPRNWRLPSVIAGVRIRLRAGFNISTLMRGNRAAITAPSYRSPNDALNRVVLFCFCSNSHSASLDRPTGQPHNICMNCQSALYWCSHVTYSSLSHRSPVVVNIVIVLAVLVAVCRTSCPRICHALYRAPVYPTRVSSLPYPTFIHPSTCLLRRCTPSLPPPTPRRTTRVSARFSLSPPASARSSRLRYLLHTLSLFTPWIHGPTRTGSITMSAPFLGPRWKSSTYTSSRASVVLSSVETVRDLRCALFDRRCVNTEEHH